jgi:hypothetical protein
MVHHLEYKNFKQPTGRPFEKGWGVYNEETSFPHAVKWES